MYILGINYPSHDTAVALIKDGAVVFSLEEERLTREKHSRNFPMLSIEACLKYEDININDISVITISMDIEKVVQDGTLHYVLQNYRESVKLIDSNMKVVSKFLGLENEIRNKLKFKNKIEFISHPLSHMASSYYLSGFTTSALYSIDGVGEIASSSIGSAIGNKISIFEDENINFPHSIGLLYAAVTDYLGFKYMCDEGKVMGLAPYGNPDIYNHVFKDIVQFKDCGKYEFNLDYLAYHKQRDVWVSEKFVVLCGNRRKDNDILTQRHMDIAASLQEITEEVMLHTAKYLYEVTKNKNLCLAGGVALNCVANGRILRETEFENIYVQPAANDAGTSIGSALYYYYLNNPTAQKHPLNNSYLGNSYSNEYIENLLNKNKIDFEVSENTHARVANLIAKNNIIAWFNGRSEFGPRALGNRSILTAPFPAKMKDILNSRVKHREGFRPFAPSVMVEHSHEYFDEEHESPYMLFAMNVNKDKIDKVPAITHIDNTARVQTVSEQQNKDYYKLINEFKNITNVPVLLDTSFNVMGEPIVETPEDAIRCFLGTNIDYLILNAKYIIKK